MLEKLAKIMDKDDTSRNHISATRDNSAARSAITGSVARY